MLLRLPTPNSRMHLLPWMGGVVDGEEAVAVDFGVDLGGREGGVTEKLLDLAQVGAGREQVGCERVAQRVGRGGFGEGQFLAQALHGELDESGA
jgi:hypothetical protein